MLKLKVATAVVDLQSNPSRNNPKCYIWQLLLWYFSQRRLTNRSLWSHCPLGRYLVLRRARVEIGWGTCCRPCCQCWSSAEMDMRRSSKVDYSSHIRNWYTTFFIGDKDSLWVSTSRSWVYFSVTRFCKISPLWQTFKSLWDIFGMLLVWCLANFCTCLENFILLGKWYKWSMIQTPKIEK